MTSTQLQAILSEVLSHYGRLRLDFGYDYPSAAVAADYRLDAAQRCIAQALVQDIHPALGEMCAGVRISEEVVADGVVGELLVDLQKQALIARGKPSEPEPPFCYRIDAIWTNNTFKIIEINPDNAGGLEDSFELRKIYRRFDQENDSPPIPAERLAAALTRLHCGQSGRIVYTDGICRVLAYRLSSILAKLGVPAAPIHINELPEEDQQFGWIYRHFLYEDLFTHDAKDAVPSPTKQAVEHFLNVVVHSEVPIYNPLSDRLIFDKRLLALEKLPDNVTIQARGAIERWVATTHMIKVDEAEALQARPPSHKVIKTAKGMGGRGVYVPGMSFAHEDIGDGYWISQDYLPPEQIRVLQDGGWQPIFNLVHGLFVVDGEFAGDHIRVSPKPVVNVSAGGGMIPAR